MNVLSKFHGNLPIRFRLQKLILCPEEGSRSTKFKTMTHSLWNMDIHLNCYCINADIAFADTLSWTKLLVKDKFWPDIGEKERNGHGVPKMFPFFGNHEYPQWRELCWAILLWTKVGQMDGQHNAVSTNHPYALLPAEQQIKESLCRWHYFVLHPFCCLGMSAEVCHLLCNLIYLKRNPSPLHIVGHHCSNLHA